MESIFPLEIIIYILKNLSNYDLFVFGSTSKRSLEQCEEIWKQRYLSLNGASKREPWLGYLKGEIAKRLKWSIKYRTTAQDIFLNKVRLYLKKQLVFSRIKEQVSFSQREMMKYIVNNQTIFNMKNDEMETMRKVIASKDKAITYIHILLEDKLSEYLKLKHLKEQKRIQLEEGLFSKCENNVFIGVIPKFSDSIYKVGIESDAFEIKDLSKDLSYYKILQNYFAWENCISFE
jgi:hypothetical protein